MGIFKRIKRMTKAEINGILDGFENPVTMLNEYSREMEAEIDKGQKALARQLFAEKKQAALLHEVEGLIAKRTRQARLAIEQGEEAMAKLAVQEKLTQEKQLSLYKQQYEALKGQTQTLVEKLNGLNQAYNELQHKKLFLASRANAAQAIKQVQKATVTFQTESIARGVARAEERILMMEAEVQAGSRLTGPLAARDLANLNLANEEDLEKEIEKLKNEKVLLPTE